MYKTSGADMTRYDRRQFNRGHDTTRYACLTIIVHTLRAVNNYN